jgi:hypothetical protein
MATESMSGWNVMTLISRARIGEHRLVRGSNLSQLLLSMPRIWAARPFSHHQRFSTAQTLELGEDLNVAICRPSGDGIAHSSPV